MGLSWERIRLSSVSLSGWPAGSDDAIVSSSLASVPMQSNTAVSDAAICSSDGGSSGSSSARSNDFTVVRYCATSSIAATASRADRSAPKNFCQLPSAVPSGST